MYNLIFQLNDVSVGSGITAKYLENTFPDIFKSYDINSNPMIPSENRIWRLQNPYFYKYPCLSRINDYIMCRKEYAKFFPGKKLVDGYSYYRRNIDKYQCWFPTVYQSNFSRNDVPSIGYYARDIRIESNMAFVDFVSKIPNEFDVVTMGDKHCIQKYLHKKKNWKHTYDNAVFWKSCSHYFYYRCSDIEDTFPQNLLEAIQSKHRIISPKDNKRTFKDGIDDFLSCIDYDIEFIPGNSGKKYDVLEAEKWSKYIHELVSSKFARHHIIYNGLLYDWICKNL